MTSSKRNKAKERKAKKVEKQESDRARVRMAWTGWALGTIIGDNGNGRTITQCDHGCDLTIPDEDENHPVCAFMDAFFANVFKEEDLLYHLTDIFNDVPQVTENRDYKKMVVKILTRIGTNMTIDCSNTTESLLLWMNKTGSRAVARAIVIIENYDHGGFDSVFGKRCAAAKLRDLNTVEDSTRRDLLKFYLIC